MLRTGHLLRPASNPASRPRTGASLPGTLASPRTGLAPAGCPQLVAWLRHHNMNLLVVMAPKLLDALPDRRDWVTTLTPCSLRVLCYRERTRRFARYRSEGVRRDRGGAFWRSVVTVPAGPHALVGEPDGGTWPMARPCGRPASTGTSAVQASNLRTESENDSVPPPTPFTGFQPNIRCLKRNLTDKGPRPRLSTPLPFP